MLNKKICRRCMAGVGTNLDIVASDYVDDCWANGNIDCRWNCEISITAEPPDDCPFILEHIVTTGGDI